MRMACYIRVSTDRQADDGCSLEMQRATLEKYLSIMNLVSDRDQVSWYCDDGYSAKSIAGRPSFLRLLKDIREGTIDALAIWDLSRLTRSIWDLRDILNLLAENEVELYCMNDDVHTETASERFSMNVRMLSYQFEREKVSERTNAVLIDLVKNKKRYVAGGKIAYGFRRTREKELVIDEERARYVREMFRLARHGMSLEQITLALNTLQSERYFQVENIRCMLKNRKYSGHYLFKGVEYDDIIPPIVTDEEQQEALDNLNHHSQKSDNYIFAGLVKCQCGTPMTNGLAWGSHYPRRYYYYHCRECNKYFSQIKLDKYFRSYRFPEGGDAFFDRIQTMLTGRQKAIRDRLRRLDEKYASGYVQEKEYLMLREVLESRSREAAEDQESLGCLNKKYADMDILEKKRYVHEKIKMITVDPVGKKVLSVEEREPLDPAESPVGKIGKG